MYIAFDGIDGSGKTTLIRTLQDKVWNSKKLFLVKLPKASILENAFANELELARKIKILEIGEDILVVQDRSILTTLTYTSLENEATDLDLEKHLATLGANVPKVIIYLDCPPEVVWKRKSDMYSLDFLKELYNGYETAIQLVDEVVENTKIVRINATKPLEEQIEEVLNAIS